MKMEKSRNMLPSPTQPNIERMRTDPVTHPRSTRLDFKRVITTGFGGKMLPIMAIPLLREDALKATTLDFSFEMAETEDVIHNPVRIKVSAYAVPKTAFERFMDLGHANRSYMKKPEADASVTPWFNTIALDDGHATAPTTLEVFKTLGCHARPGVDVNTDYLEAYNAIWNDIASQTSENITHRTPTDGTLAPAFWMHSAMKHVKPNFDQALIYGEVPLNTVGTKLPVKGIGANNTGYWDDTNKTVYESGGSGSVTYSNAKWFGHSGNREHYVQEDPDNPGYPGIFAEMEENGITVSLANNEMAKKMVSMAQLRRQFAGLDDDAIIDVLMSGIRIPDEGLKRPILLGAEETTFGMHQRYATDHGNLEKSLTRGQSGIQMTIRTPQMNTGAIVMAVCEILPEQLYERQEDVYLATTDQDTLPERVRDELDPEPVEVVTNAMIDTDHDTPDATFGYAPLNHRWQREIPNLGGRYYQPRAGQAWNEDRNRIWSTELENPTLGPDFYLSTTLHHNLFSDTLNDPFEVTCNAVAQIEGNTKFGPALIESVDDYDHIAAQVDTTKIDQS